MLRIVFCSTIMDMEERELRFVNPEDLKLTVARLALVSAVRQVLVNGLTVLGVSAPDELS